MFCPNCGNELREDAYFCGSCGTQVGNAIQPTQQHPANQRPLTAEDLKNYHEAARAEREFEKNFEKTSEYAVLMEEEHKRLKSRFTICTILGAIIAIFFGTLMMGSMAQSTSTASFDSAPVVLIACAFYFFIPFGCLPVIDFCKKHGFVIWATAVFFVFLIMFILMFALFAGIPSFFSLRSKIKRTKAEADLANEQLTALVA